MRKEKKSHHSRTPQHRNVQHVSYERVFLAHKTRANTQTNQRERERARTSHCFLLRVVVVFFGGVFLERRKERKAREKAITYFYEKKVVFFFRCWTYLRA